MGFWTDIKAGFVIKAYIKRRLNEINDKNIIEIFDGVVTKTNNEELSAGSRENILKSIIQQFTNIINRFDIPQQEKNRLINNLS